MTAFDDNDRRGQSLDSYISGGCVISGGTVRRSILGPQCRINSYSLVIFNITARSLDQRNAKIKRAIIDEGVEIPDGADYVMTTMLISEKQVIR